MSVHLSPSPGGREYEIRTTDIISSDCEASQPPDAHYQTNNAIQDSAESQTSSTDASSLPASTKESQSQTAELSQTDLDNVCTAPTKAPHQQNCSTDLPLASSSDALPTTTSNQEHSHVHSPPSQASPALDAQTQPGPLTVQTPNPSEAATPPSTATQLVSQPQSPTQTQVTVSAGAIPAQVNGSSPSRDAHTEAIKPANPQAHVSPTLSSSSPQPASSSMEGSPVNDAPVPGFATLGRRLMLTGLDSHHPTPFQQHPHNHYPAMEYSTALDKKQCYSAHTPQLHPSSYSNYSTISIPLPHPQPPLPEKRHLPVQPGSPGEGVRLAVGYVPPPTQHQHHVTFSPTVGEIVPTAGQNNELASMESANRVSVKFVQDSSRFWYKPGISREQGRSIRGVFLLPSILSVF